MCTTQIALAGATGNLGLPILNALLDAGVYVTVLSREGGSNSSKLKPHPRLTIKVVNFNSVETLTFTLLGIDIVISCLATLAIGSQNPLIDAAVAAGVKRFIPAEFGMDSANALCIELPVCAPKAETQRYLLEESDSNPGFTYTAIANGLFLDWGLKMGLILNLDQHTAILYNGGDVQFSATTLADVAKAVLGIIQHPNETANRIMYVHSALVSQNELIQCAKDIDGREWKTVIKDTEELRQESLAELAKGSNADIDAAMLGFCFVGSFHPDYGCDFSGHLDNELLGVKEMSKAELKLLIKGLM